jgi:recombination protein RecR
MMNDPIDTLTSLLRELPGIGPRQGRRIAHAIAKKHPSWIHRLTTALAHTETHVSQCSVCMRLFARNGSNSDTVCSICSNPRRATGTLLLVEKDADLENIERTGAYTGHYFVLGGTTSPRAQTPAHDIALPQLEQRLCNTALPVREIIFACSATAEGEDTERFVRAHLAGKDYLQGITLSTLGRGLSTGSELEYIDSDTLQHALRGRKSD